MSGTLRLAAYSRTHDRLSYEAEIAGHRFTTTFRYGSLDLLELEELHGRELLKALYFHAIAFDLNRLVSLAPERVDFGPLAGCATAEFAELWQRVVDGVWGQWRYENDLPGYRGPEIVHPPAAGGSRPLGRLTPRSQRSLVFCGGGKDSLLAAKLYEEIGEPFETLAYSHSIYGPPQPQHALIDGLLDHCAARHRHRLWIDDELLHGPEVDPAAYGVRSLTAAETPGALFLSLPLALAHGLGHLVVAHEKSADSGNLVWPRTGEEINHQWGKSLEAETLLDDYVRRRLLGGTRYFSLIKGVQDAVIFPSLRPYRAAIPATHSCNRNKPWCRRCAKCVYVWLGYAAFLPRELVLTTFGENLFDVADNLPWFAGLLGLGDHLPFECVGQVEESRLALALAARRGWAGVAIDRYASAAAAEVDAAVMERLFAVEGNPHRLPQALAARVMPRLAARGREAGTWAARTLAGDPAPRT